MHTALDTTNLEGWYSRSRPLAPELAETFTPILTDYKSSVRIDRRGGSTIHLALFQPNIAMNDQGILRALSSSDFEGLVSLAEKVAEVSSKESGRGWRTISDTCTRFHILQLPTPTAEEPWSVVETSVYGYTKGWKHLSIPVGDITELPDIVHDFFALAREAESRYSGLQGENKVYDAVERIVKPPERFLATVRRMQRRMATIR